MGTGRTLVGGCHAAGIMGIARAGAWCRRGAPEGKISRPLHRLSFVVATDPLQRCAASGAAQVDHRPPLTAGVGRDSRRFLFSPATGPRTVEHYTGEGEAVMGGIVGGRDDGVMDAQEGLIGICRRIVWRSRQR